MSNSLESLLNEMKVEPRTLKWDAIVCYNRTKTNALLTQQYIQKYTSGSMLDPISGEIEIGSMIHKITALQISAPRLSFENASLDDAKARLTLDMMGAKIISTIWPDTGFETVSGIQHALPLNAPKLFMEIELRKAVGSTGADGVVQLDLSEGVAFRVNFVEKESDQSIAGAFFKEIFLKEGEKLLFELGGLSEFSNDILTPKNFYILTQPAPGATARGADNYGDGAVVMFVTLRDGQDQSLPVKNTGLLYFIPDDLDADGNHRYSGAVVLSNEVVFRRVFAPQIIQDMGYGLAFKANPSITGALEAETGEISFDNFEHHYKVRSDDFDAYFRVAKISVPMGQYTQGYGPFTVKPYNQMLRIEWTNVPASPWSNVINWHWPNQPEWKYGDLHVDHRFNVDFKPSLDPETGVVTFERSGSRAFNLALSGFERLDFFDRPSEDIRTKITNLLKPILEAKFQALRTPDINTFMINNLLFPGSNTLRLSDVSLPGDLAMFGQIDPALTSFQVYPTMPMLLDEEEKQFEIGDIGDVRRNADITWSARGIDGETSGIGDIDPVSGLYTAPSAADIEGDFIRVVITATQSGTGYSSSALATVLVASITVNPLFQTCSKTGTALVTAAALGVDESQIGWDLKVKNPEHDSKIEPDPKTPGTWIYSPGKTVRGTFFTLDTVEVTNEKTGAVARSHILVSWQNLTNEVRIDDTFNEPGKVKLLFLGDDWGEPAPIEGADWELLGGDGRVDENGIYTEPATPDQGFAVITAHIGPGNASDPIGYIALALPLAKYSRHYTRVARSE